MPEDQSSSKSNICPSVIYSNATKYKYHLIYSICTYKQYLLSYYIRDIFQNRFFKSLTHNDHRHRDLKKNDFVKCLYSPIVSFY